MQLVDKSCTSDQRIVKLFASVCIDSTMAQKRRKKSNSVKWSQTKIITALASFTLGCFSLSVFGEDLFKTVTNANQNLACLSQFYAQTPAYPIKSSLEKDSYTLCMNGFSVFYSGVSKTPLYVGEFLDPVRLDPSKKIPREDNFHEEEAVLPEHRATLADYRGSGYDRGHMAPNADMNNKDAQSDSFSLANMVPQAPKNNQQVWRELEEATRALVTKQKQDVYVITGPVYKGNKLKVIGNNKVIVPTAVYKVLYLPKLGIASAYLAPNDNSLKVESVSICALEELTGFNLLPTLDEDTKRKVYQLPKKATQVKANTQLQYLRSDQASQCAADLSPQQLKQMQARFVPNQSELPSSVESSDSAEQIKSLLMKWLQHFIESLLKSF